MNPRGFFFFLELNYIREVIFLFGSNATFSNFFAPLNIPNTAVPTLSVRRAESRRGGRRRIDSRCLCSRGPERMDVRVCCSGTKSAHV